jgi:hypothetical protein
MHRAVTVQEGPLQRCEGEAMATLAEMAEQIQVVHETEISDQ